jgi:acyl dehydratase
LFCRADGGFDGKREVTREFSDTPKHPPDISQVISTQANQALYYRLNGDRNPLHADPDYAKMAGFPRPILHGLCTYSAVAICLQRMVGLDRKLLSIQARFSKPVYPGETIQVDGWYLSSGIAFRATVTDRNVEVLGRGLATFL